MREIGRRGTCCGRSSAKAGGHTLRKLILRPVGGVGVPRQGPGLIPGGKRLQSETQKRSQANAPHTVAQPLPMTPLPRRGWEPATHPLLEGPALGGKGFHGRILTCPHPLGPRTSSQSFSGRDWDGGRAGGSQAPDGRCEVPWATHRFLPKPHLHSQQNMPQLGFGGTES